jgi:nucleotide-binding universal stress UspA family protein
MHALLGLEIAMRIASSTGAAIHLLRIVKPGVDPQKERQTLPRSARTIVGDFSRIHYLSQQHESVSSGLQASLDGKQYDMVIIGASEEWRIRNVLFGSIPDLVADYANCSVLMVRRYLPDHWSVKATTGIKRIKESVGLTTSPENNDRA